MPFSKRRMNQKELQIFSRTGQVVAILTRITPTVAVDVPTNVFTQYEEPLEATEFTKSYIVAKFEEDTTDEGMTNVGRMRVVTGRVIVPFRYKDALVACTYINPYNDGVSRFEKVGGYPDEERLFITQKIKSVLLKVAGEVN